MIREVQEVIGKAKQEKHQDWTTATWSMSKPLQYYFLPLWVDLFNQCMATGKIPEIWRTATMVKSTQETQSLSPQKQQI